MVATSTRGKSWSYIGWGPDTIHGGVTLQDGSLLVTAYREEGDSIRIYRAADSRSKWKHQLTVDFRSQSSFR